MEGTGVKRPAVTASQLNTTVSEKTFRFEKLFIPFPRHIHLHEQFDYLRQRGQLSQGRAQKGLRVLGPSNSGKTTAVEAYIERAKQLDPPTKGTIPFVKIDLEKSSTTKKLMTSILIDMGDAYATSGNEQILKIRAFNALRRFKVQLLFVDEIQHLKFGGGVRAEVTDVLKLMLDMGIVPIVFLGTEDAKQIFNSNIQLSSRLLAPCDLKPLDPAIISERDMFVSFVRRMEESIFTMGILPEKSDFQSLGLMPSLFEASSGIVGRASRLFEEALRVALSRGAHKLEPYDLALATETYGKENLLLTHNPFREWLNV